MILVWLFSLVVMHLSCELCRIASLACHYMPLLRCLHAASDIKTWKIEIRLGIGTLTFNVSFVILTLIWHCTLYVVETNTPLLRMLKDPDEKWALFNNLRNLIWLENGTNVLIIRLLGHGFLQRDPIVTISSYQLEPKLRILHRRFGHSSA